jgi:homoserine O-acetyltransferase
MAMTWAWIHNDISANEVFAGDLAAALGAITARTLLMPCATDLYFLTEDSRAELAQLRHATLVEIPSHWGHMAGAGQSKEATAFIDAKLKTLLGASDVS